MKKNTAQILLLSFLMIGLLCGCQSRSSDPVSKTGFYFDTLITITLYDSSKQPLIDECFKLAADYENLLSATREESDISKINQSAGNDFVKVDKRTIEVIDKGLYYSALSKGNFDITVGKLSKLWNISDISKNIQTDDNSVDRSCIPDDKDIAAILPSINYENVLVDEDKVKLLDANCEIDLGAIAKGFIADKMKEYLVSNSAGAGFINLGGNVLTLGAKSDGSSYKVGIQKPFGQTNDPILKLSLTDRSIVTSGIYERYFKVDDKIYHHILDLKTGYPCENDLYSVTIISDMSADGDALSTICFILGQEEGLKLIESIPDTEAIFIDSNYNITYSSGASAYITK